MFVQAGNSKMADRSFTLLHFWDDRLTLNAQSSRSITYPWCQEWNIYPYPIIISDLQENLSLNFSTL